MNSVTRPNSRRVNDPQRVHSSTMDLRGMVIGHHNFSLISVISLAAEFCSGNLTRLHLVQGPENMANENFLVRVGGDCLRGSG